MKDFRQVTFETLFEEGLTSLKEKEFNISSLSENQNLSHPRRAVSRRSE